MDRQASAEWRAQLLHTWQLAVLRFAITLDDADRLHLLAIADEIDRGGQFDRQSSFSFFRSCSTELCAASPAAWTCCGEGSRRATFARSSPERSENQQSGRGLRAASEDEC